MKWVLIGLGVIVLLCAALSAYVRLAPSDPDEWHQMPEDIADRDLEGGAMRVVDAGEDGLTQLDAIIQETPRTQVLAGSVDEAMITYVTRSLVFGFPDYTTVQQTGSELRIYGRLRFGASDLGVNAARIDGWLKAFAEDA